MAALCPECENLIVVDPDAVEEGDTVECEECGSELEILTLEPLRITLIDTSGYDDPEDLSFIAEEE